RGAGDRAGRGFCGFRGNVAHRASCCASSSRVTWWAMPMPPALTKDFEYSSVRNDRQMLAPLPPLNGPWPTPENICWNMLLRNTASKSSLAALALAARLAAGLETLLASAAVAAGD